MKCLRCGRCCLNPLVVVVKPEVVKEDLNLETLGEDDFLCLTGQLCPHLKFDSEATCSIHHFDWYEDTPCFRHGQIERSIDDECRTGRYLTDRPDMLNSLRRLYKMP